MLKFINTKNNQKLFLFYLVLWIFGVVIASIWGLGWFFLVETLRRIVTYFSPLRRWLTKIVFGKDSEPETFEVTPSTKLVSNVIGGIIIFVWIGLTIFVFLQANVSLSMVFGYLRSAK